MAEWHQEVLLLPQLRGCSTSALEALEEWLHVESFTKREVIHERPAIKLAKHYMTLTILFQKRDACCYITYCIGTKYKFTTDFRGFRNTATSP